MKTLISILTVLALTLTLCACSFGNTENTEPETTKAPETTAPTSMPTLPTVQPNVPETTEGRGSTDDKEDDPNETIGDDLGERMRRRIMK